jgi:pimeloyl-ACP methyl ester carboxylesterase
MTFLGSLRTGRGLLLAIVLSAVTSAPAKGQDLNPPKLTVPYGDNAAAGKYEQLNGVTLYYESYGTGLPMLLIHGNGASISAMGNQIEFFARQYTVLAPDSRGHGKSESGGRRLTYDQMAEDISALLDKLGHKSVHVLGWSDGGIVGLLLAMRHPETVDRLAIMGANLNPAGIYPWVLEGVAARKKQVEDMIAKGDTTQPWSVIAQQLSLALNQPNIAPEELKAIGAPTLVMAGDRDAIRDEHTLEIFHYLPNAQLCIFPGATHMIPWQNPSRFNATVDTFFSTPFATPETKD